MDKLLNPDIGLMVWTVVTFLVLVLILKKAAWKPILDGLEKREGRIRSDLDRAEKAQAEAEDLRRRYETQLAEAQRRIQEMVNQAKADGDRTRAEIIAEAKAESERLLEKGRRDLEGEAERLKGELKKDVAGLSVTMAEKILARSVDPKLQEEILSQSLSEISEVKR